MGTGTSLLCTGPCSGNEDIKVSFAVSGHEIGCKFPQNLGSGLVESSNKLRFLKGRVDTCRSVHECMLLEISSPEQRPEQKEWDVNIVSKKDRAPQEPKASPMRVTQLLGSNGGGKGAPVVVKRGQGLSEYLFNRFEDFRLARYL